MSMVFGEGFRDFVISFCSSQTETKQIFKTTCVLKKEIFVLPQYMYPEDTSQQDKSQTYCNSQLVCNSIGAFHFCLCAQLDM